MRDEMQEKLCVKALVFTNVVSSYAKDQNRVSVRRWCMSHVEYTNGNISMYPPSVITPFPKYGDCFGKWALA